MTYYDNYKFVSNSMLGDFIASPLLFKALYITRELPAKPATEDMLLGTATHLRIFEPEIFEKAVVTPPADVLSKTGSRNTNAYRAWADEHKDCIILTSKQRDLCYEMTAAFLQHRVGDLLLKSGGESEKECYWTCELSLLNRKAKIDRLAPPFICDVKTVRLPVPSKDAFIRYALNLNLHRQAAYYLDAAEALELDANQFMNIAVSRDPPHLIGCFVYGPQSLRLGQEEIHGALQRLSACYETQDWTDRDLESVQQIDYRRYAFENHPELLEV